MKFRKHRFQFSIKSLRMSSPTNFKATFKSYGIISATALFLNFNVIFKTPFALSNVN